jgi:hypothetical protein
MRAHRQSREGRELPAYSVAVRPLILSLQWSWLPLQGIHYLSAITVKQGKVYAMFVKCPANVSSSASFPVGQLLVVNGGAASVCGTVCICAAPANPM